MSRSFRERVYGDYYATTFTARNEATDAAYAMRVRVLRQVLLPWLPPPPASRVLEVACGIGYALETLKRAGYTDAHGIDLSAQQVEIARERGLAAEHADAFEYLAGRRAEYDAIVALDFIEHLDRDELFRFLDLAREALRPGGRLFVRTANANSLLAARLRWVDLTHELSFTDHSLRVAFRSCGLEPVSVHGQTYVPFTVLGFAREIVARFVRGLWKVYLIAELGREGVPMPTEFDLVGVAERR